MTIKEKILNCIADKKGHDVVVLDVSKHSTITDSVIIAEGNIDRHVMAIGQAIYKELKEAKISCIYAEGLQTGDWILLDYGTVIVHIFHPEMRKKYRLEELYST